MMNILRVLWLVVIYFGFCIIVGYLDKKPISDPAIQVQGLFFLIICGYINLSDRLDRLEALPEMHPDEPVNPDILK